MFESFLKIYFLTKFHHHFDGSSKVTGYLIFLCLTNCYCKIFLTKNAIKFFRPIFKSLSDDTTITTNSRIYCIKIYIESTTFKSERLILYLKDGWWLMGNLFRGLIWTYSNIYDGALLRNYLTAKAIKYLHKKAPS